MCSGEAAESIALQKAAVEAINRGFSRFRIVDGSSDKYVVGRTPVTAHTTGSAHTYGNIHTYSNTGHVSATTASSATTTYSGGTPLIAKSQSFTVKMFHGDEPEAANALSARDILGSDWREVMDKMNKDGSIIC